MSQLKIAVYAICKNEEKFIPRWVKSMREADAIFVTDTGSDDASVELLKKSGVNVSEIKLTEWRFDKARNLSLSVVPDDYDICVCTDLDEVFSPNWRQALEKVWVKGVTTRVKYPYIWSFKENGESDVSFYLEKIHALHGFRWVHPVHEVLEYYGDLPDRYATCDAITLSHYPDHTKSRAQYLELLELSVQEAPEDDRNRHYLGREYMYYGRYDEAITTLKQHLMMKTADWLDERAASMRYIARCYKNKNDRYNASRWYYRAIAEAPYLREGYVEAALLAFEEGDWETVYALVTQALKIKTKPASYINEGFCWDGTVFDIGAIAAYYMGLKEKAAAWAKEALRRKPDDARLQQNFKIFTS